MECNKDEAIRAKEIAERKMANNDFEGARKIALRARNLDPELVNITQLLSICDVHCSAQNRILGAERDWYGILQVEKLADESTVKKQYRKLALSIHPDKNQFPGAEAAFKLICEAHAVLSDPTTKANYDNRIRYTVRSAPVNPPFHQMNRNYQFNRQYERQTNIPNGFSSLNQHQAAKPSSSVKQELFWTICPFCHTKYQYDRIFARKYLRCMKCMKDFTAFENSHGGPLGSQWAPPTAQPSVPKADFGQSTASQERTQDQCKSKMSVQNGKESSSSSSYARFPQSATKKAAPFKPVILTESVFKSTQAASTPKVSGISKAKQRDTNADNLTREGETCNGDSVDDKKGGVKNKTKKRGRKRVDESSESYGTSSESDIEDVTTVENLHNPKTDMNDGTNNAFLRRSSRRRTHVSYQEGDDDGEDQNNLLDSKNLRPACQSSNVHGDSSNSKSKGVEAVQPEEKSVLKKDVDIDRKTNYRQEAGGSSEKVETQSDSLRDSNCGDNLDNAVFQCQDTQFYDFDKDRHESCFAADQIWACYDDAGTMPRFYAKVKKVRVSPFEVTLTWLEATDPIDEAHEQWIEQGLPVACGTFKLGKTDKLSECDSFSHKVHFEKGKKRNSFVIFPKPGEIWALFRDWDMSWSSDIESHKEFKYEIVEVLTDYDAASGVAVSYLDKVEGHVSVYRRSSQSGVQSFLIGPNQLYRFSHYVPSYKIKSSERRVPVGSFELDPASLPLNPDDLWYPGKARMNT